MMNVRQWWWQNASNEMAEPGGGLARLVVGITASGLDLVAELAIRLQQDQCDTVGHYLLQSAALPEVTLRSQNQRALALLQTWLAEPDDLGDDWWDAFERDLEQHRLFLPEVT